MRLAATWLLACGCDRLLGLSPVAPIDAAIDSPYPPYVNAVLADSPVGYFRFDETAGTEAIDMTGGPSGMDLGMVTLGQPGAFADSGTSVAFDGKNAGVSLGNRFDFTGTAPFTLEAWIQPSFAGTFHEIGGRWHFPPEPSGYTWYQDGADFGFERDGATTDLVGYNGALVENQWAYLVATYDGTTMAIYLGGDRVNTTTSTMATPEVGLATMIGAANGDPTASPFLGNIDEYAIYDHALSADRVMAHFTAATQAR